MKGAEGMLGRGVMWGWKWNKDLIGPEWLVECLAPCERGDTHNRDLRNREMSFAGRRRAVALLVDERG